MEMTVSGAPFKTDIPPRSIMYNTLTCSTRAGMVCEAQWMDYECSCTDRSIIGKSVIVLLSLFLVFVLSPSLQAGEKEDYQAARNNNTIGSWDSYLKKYPKGQNAKVAREAHDNLLWQEAEKSAENPTALETLFKRCKTPSGSDKVFRLWDDALWAVSKKTDTMDAYSRYLLRFPGGQRVKEAKTAVEEAAWRGCQESGKVESYKAYLKEYPSGTHAKEAKAVINNFTYQVAQEKDTIEGYESFLKDNSGHKEAGKRLRQLRYEQAVRTGTLEHWKAFYDQYRYSRWTDDGKDVDQMKENAVKEIERLLYERIAAEATLELCRDYMNRYRDGIHKQQVIVKMEPCLFDEAVRTNKLETYFEYLEKYPEGYRDLDIRTRLDKLVFKNLSEKEDFSSFERYLRLSPKTKDVLLARMEPFMFEWAKRVNSVESYGKYLSRYPDGAHLREVQMSMDPVLFKKAQEEDWYSTYEDYIKKCPNGANVQKARDRVAWLKANKTEVVMDYQRTVEETASPYGNVGRPFWPIDTVFKETSGKIGFRVSGSSARIDDIHGGSWSGSGRGMVKIPTGGTVKDDYWVNSTDHELCNGYMTRTWSGEDAGGHPIRLEQRVKLQHTGCPGHKKK
jgi:hypothetical protein